MASDEYKYLASRAQILQDRFFPPLHPQAVYTEAEQDNMRALRMLFHAEVEHYLENMCKKLAKDLEREAMGLKDRASIKQWALNAVKEASQAATSNNGIKAADIKHMFSPLGFTDTHFDDIGTTFLSTMNIFGGRRGDVAHQSVMNVTYSITRQTDEPMIKKILDFLQLFDKQLEKQRLTGFLSS